MNKLLILLSGIVFLFATCRKDKSAYNPGVAPAIVTNYPVNVSARSAELIATAHSGGKEITKRGFYIALLSPAMYTSRGELDKTKLDSILVKSGTPVDVPAKGDFKGFIDGLIMDTIYFVKAYAVNDAGQTYGESVKFRSSKMVQPTVKMNAEYINIGDSAAVVKGEVTAIGGDLVTERGLVWSTHENPELTDQKSLLGKGQGSFSDTLPSLRSFVKYYIRAYAVNSIGIAYSEQLVVIFLPPSYTDLRDGEKYTIKQYGNDVWMTQNFRYIPETGFGVEIWVQGYAGTDGAEARKTTYFKEYGCLYAYDIAVASAPVGWHLATDEEWKQLEMLTGLSRTNADALEWRGGSNYKLKSDLWGGSGNNSMEFNLDPGGKQWCGGAFQDFQSLGFYWTAIDTGLAPDADPYYRFFSPGTGTGRWNNWPRCVGQSVRYVRD